MSKLGTNFKMGTLLFLVVFAGASALLYGGAQLAKDSSVAQADAGGGGAAPGGPVNATIVGKNLLFDPRTVTASPGAAVTVTFDNEDAGVLHNIQFFGNRNRSSTLGKTDVAAGPNQHTVTFTAPTAPGNYPFICDVHPDTMTGNLVVK